MTFIRILAAILLPPLAVFLTRGLRRDFWIAVVLTLIAFVPGMVFALYVALTDRRAVA
ncbi:MAG TPA: YqaE/Pmp3 family membrane protein [Sphingomonas sp.]|jgi:uncharacterized membrane protein YqaE (UPF0057 family)|uniref:YqaE/Pmp3 family membrane protein n=1 Tax=Sphingomonas sp. TaxID=28214 RepID=UPI002EDABCFD